MHFILGFVIGAVLAYSFRGFETRKLEQANAFLHSEILKLKTKI